MLYKHPSDLNVSVKHLLNITIKSSKKAEKKLVMISSSYIKENGKLIFHLLNFLYSHLTSLSIVISLSNRG